MWRRYGVGIASVWRRCGVGVRTKRPILSFRAFEICLEHTSRFVCCTPGALQIHTHMYVDRSLKYFYKNSIR